MVPYAPRAGPPGSTYNWARPFNMAGPASRWAKELHGCDTAMTIAAASLLATTNTNASSFTLNLIQQGTGFFNRVGRKISMKSIRLKYHLVCRHFQTTQDVVSSVCRAVVIYDQQPSGTLPTYDTIFAQTDQAGTDTGTILDNVRFDNTSRFKVLSDKVFVSNAMTMVGTTDADYQDINHFCDEYVKLKGLETVFSGTSSPATIADISTGALYVYFRATQNAGTLSQWRSEATSVARLRFYD